jgi:hypothetical protein
MPKLILNFMQGVISDIEIATLGIALRPIVAKYADDSFTADDVDFEPREMHPSALMSLPISFELETIGFDHRKDRLNEAAMIRLKEDTLFLRAFPIRLADMFLTNGKTDRKKPLYWVKFQDPAGVHI